MLKRFKGIMGVEVAATDGSLGNAIRFFVEPTDWSVPLVMVGGGQATTGELMMPTKLVDEMNMKDSQWTVNVRRRSVMSPDEGLSGGYHGVFDALRLMGANVTARGEELGKVVDLVVDTDQPWFIKYLVVSIQGQEPDGESLFSTEWISAFDLEAKHADLDVNRNDVQDCPQCDYRKGVEQEYERELHKHYDKPIHVGRFG